MTAPTYRTIASQERDLIRQAQQGDETAINLLLQAHDGFLRSMAHHYSRVRGFEFDDAMQEARVGFVDGVRRFDLRRKTRLLTFAAWWMRHRIHRELQNCVGDIRVPVWQQDKHRMKPIRAKRLDAPLAAKNGDADLTLADMLVANEPAPDDAVYEWRRQRAIKAAVEKALKVLDERELLIARERISRHKQDQTTLAAVGRKLGVSRERVRQIENRVLAKLRKRMAKSGLELLAA